VKSKKSESNHYVSLGRRHWDTPMEVEYRHFKRFHRRMQRQLLKLVEQWADRAAPAAIRAGRRFGSSHLL
jgi:hypothetical protein